jgi:prepilin-type processing-associated H-X9-DG protein
MSQVTQSRPSTVALVTFVLGVSSLVFSLVTALPALYIGVRAVRAINTSDDRIGGRRLAIAGMAIAGFTLLVTVLGFTALVLLNVQEKSYQVGCTNNLRATGEAVSAYSDLHEGHFPAATVANPALMPEQRLSWQAAVVPVLPRGPRGADKRGKLAADIAPGNFGGLHRDGANVLWADGSVRFMKADIPAPDFRALSRIRRDADK